MGDAVRSGMRNSGVVMERTLAKGLWSWWQDQHIFRANSEEVKPMRKGRRTSEGGWTGVV